MPTKQIPATISELSPILAAHDIALAIDFYTQKLGFDLVGQMGDPIEYAILSRGGYAIHFKRIDEPLIANGAFEGNLNAGKGGVYIKVDNVNAIAEELTERGVTGFIPPEDKEYGMRDFWVADPFGYSIAFGASM